MSGNDAEFWQKKYWDLFLFASQQLGEAFEAACKIRDLPIEPR
jgi:hypothetical protein